MCTTPPRPCRSGPRFDPTAPRRSSARRAAAAIGNRALNASSSATTTDSTVRTRLLLGGSPTPTGPGKIADDIDSPSSCSSKRQTPPKEEVQSASRRRTNVVLRAPYGGGESPGPCHRATGGSLPQCRFLISAVVVRSLRFSCSSLGRWATGRDEAHLTSRLHASDSPGASGRHETEAGH